MPNGSRPRTMLIALVALVVSAGAVTYALTRNGSNNGTSATTGGSTAASGSLSQTAQSALKAAIDDEYKAHSTYEAVIARFGSVKPFSNIVKAEETHIASLKTLFDKYGLSVPSNPYTNLSVKSTVAANCQVGVDAEIANVALYRDKLLPDVRAYPDVTSVFNSLMSASRDRHLPAFKRCAG